MFGYFPVTWILWLNPKRNLIAVFPKQIADQQQDVMYISLDWFCIKNIAPKKA